MAASQGLLKKQERTFMQHETYIKEEKLGVLPKLLAVLAMVVVLAGAGAYVVYGSGMWNPPQAASH
jgi:hypothetical protein